MAMRHDGSNPTLQTTCALALDDAPARVRSCGQLLMSALVEAADSTGRDITLRHVQGVDASGVRLNVTTADRAIVDRRRRDSGRQLVRRHSGGARSAAARSTGSRSAAAAAARPADGLTVVWGTGMLSGALA